MKKLTLILGVLFTWTSLSAQNNSYKAFLDLNVVKDDKVKVSIELPAVSASEIEYQMPKIVPGTYSIYDFGRFLSDFKAFDANGNELSVDSLDQNRWLIKNASSLAKVEYWVEDSYDTEQGNTVFEPAGTNIEEGKNFVINTFGFFGYLKGMKDVKYEVNISYPEGFYGATSLQAAKSENNTDTYIADNYFSLADAPMMYSVPDTTTINVGGAEILFSVYSPNGLLTAEFVKDNVNQILEAQKNYLGGTLPIKKYAYIIYLFAGPSQSGALGALEHSYSSMYSLPEVNPKYLTQLIKDVSAHEFFHIITPLSIHSEEIGNFNFIDPKMSKHLWMYEGVTEYFAGHVQLAEGLYGIDEYLSKIEEKVVNAAGYNDTVPFTVMSKLCLDQYKDQYGNVYEKGALIGLCLDIRLRELSGGKYSVNQLLKDLSNEYGKDKSFKDDELFDKITELTYPEIREFFSTYVEGNKPLPLKEYLAKIGVSFTPSQAKMEPSMGNISFGLDQESGHLVVAKADNLNAFGIDMGYKEGDHLLEFDGIPLTVQNFQEAVMAYKESRKEGDKITALVQREVKPGKIKNVKLKAKAIMVKMQSPPSIEMMASPTQQQLDLLYSWMSK
ncbi:MAG: peptidase M61 [Imperialibacter sp.]|uniref:M61 family metallopeptidase n=1 Tax=Imperialibacter sp. TaxID=2038411 RepID=UPI0032EAAB1E